MSEFDQLQNARSELATAIKLVNRKLNVFASANVKYATSKIIDVKNNILDAFKEVKIQFNRYKEKDIAKMNDIKGKTLQIQDGVTQKVKSTFSKLGTVKNRALQNLSQIRNAFDVKVSNALTKAKLAGLQIETKGLELASGNKNYSSDQIAKLSAWRYDQQQVRNERKVAQESKMRQMMAEQMEEQARRERTREHVDAMKEILKEQDRQEREKAFLKFKYGVTQKVKSTFSKLGTVKNRALQNLSQLRNTFDVKVSNALTKVKLAGLQIETKGLELANGIKNYSSDQIAKFSAWRYEQQQVRNERKAEQESKMRQMMAEQIEEQARRERTREHADAMKEILKEQDRQEREKAFLKFKYGVTQKVKSTFSKLGTVKNSALQNLSQIRNTFDVKVSNALTKAKLAGLQIETKGLELASGIKNYSSDQIAKFSAWRYEQQQARNERKAEQESEKNRIMAEQMEEQARCERTREHVDAMKEILKEQDRQALLEEQRKLQEQYQAQMELMQKAKNEFFGFEEKQEVETKGRSL